MLTAHWSGTKKGEQKMSGDNFRLFDDDHAALGELIDNIGNLSSEECKRAWPRILADIVDLFLAELMRSGMNVDDATKYAPKLAATLGHYFGGRSYYIPTGETLKLALRDNMLFHDYQRGNGDIKKLAEKYKLTDSRIYLIIREQVALHRKRFQIDMFGEKR